MTIDKKFVDQFINITSKAALASSYLVGKKDKIGADKSAVDSMRYELNKLDHGYFNNLELSEMILNKISLLSDQYKKRFRLFYLP